MYVCMYVCMYSYQVRSLVLYMVLPVVENCMCMHVNEFIYIYIYTYIHTYIHTHTHTHTHIFNQTEMQSGADATASTNFEAVGQRTKVVDVTLMLGLDFAVTGPANSAVRAKFVDDLTCDLSNR